VADITIFPDSTRNKLIAWGQTQLPNGMIPEQLACGCTSKIDPSLDKGCGRVMSDVSSMYIVYVLELLRWGNDTTTLDRLYPVVRRAAEWQMNVSAEDGLPQHLVNTYDILGPNRYKHVSYNSVFHLLAMAAARELATFKGDVTFAAKCAAALLRGQKALDSQQWVAAETQSVIWWSHIKTNTTSSSSSSSPSGGMGRTHYELKRGFLTSGNNFKPTMETTFIACMTACSSSSRCLGFSFQAAVPAPATGTIKCYTKTTATCVPVGNASQAPHYSFADSEPASLMADSLYGQVLAHSVGLGTVLADATKIKQHLQTEALWNDSPDGLRVESNAGKSSGSGLAVWQGASPNWAYLNIVGDGNTSFMGVDQALQQPAKSLGLWRSRLNDLWNICGLAQNGQSWITSHYGFAMTAWHLPFALSGQNANLPDGSLTFAPKIDVASNWALPVFLPGVMGTINHTFATGQYSLAIKFGELTLRHLAVGTAVHPGPVSVSAGQSVQWE
jgi:hypothetical protein